MQEPLIYTAWEVPAPEKCVRGVQWWIVAGIVSVALFAYALFTMNFAFAVILLMFAAIMFILEKQEHEPVRVVVADVGIFVNDALFPYTEIREFFVVEDLSKVYFVTSRVMVPRFSVLFPEDIDSGELRMLLRERIIENVEQREEPLSDALARKLKLF